MSKLIRFVINMGIEDTDCLAVDEVIEDIHAVLDPLGTIWGVVYEEPMQEANNGT